MDQLPPSPPEPSLLLTCAHCGRLHEPRVPLGLELHPLCPFCAPPPLSERARSVGPLD